MARRASSPLPVTSGETSRRDPNDERRAVVTFAAAAFGVSLPLALVYGPVLGGPAWVAGVVTLATRATAAAAWTLRGPLGRARWNGRTGRAARLGVRVAVRAGVALVVVLGVLWAVVGGAPLASALAYALVSGVVALAVLVPAGALVGALFAMGGA